MIEAEQVLIGATMRKGSADGVPIQPQDFQRHAHQLIWRAMQAHHACDIVLVANTLGNDLNEVGGREYLLTCFESAVGPSQVSIYAPIIRQHAEKRALIQAASRIANSDDDATPDEIRAQMEAALLAAPSQSPPVVNIADIRPFGKRRGICTGWAGLDACVQTGGYAIGQQTVVSAYTKTGKSVFMLQSALHVAQKIGRVLYATFADLDRDDIKRRWMMMFAGVREPDPFDDALESLDKIPLDVYDAAELTSGSDVETFCAVVRAEHAKSPLVAVYVDYAGKLSTRDKRATSEYMTHTICSGQLSRLAAATHLPIIVGSQITEGGKEGRDTTKSSRAWEENAGWVIRLKRDEGSDQTEVRSVYSRFGGSGNRVWFKWDKQHECYREGKV